MMRTLRRLLSLSAVVTTGFCLAVPASAQTAVQTTPAGPWQQEFAAFDAADKVSPPVKGGIVFVGSSTIRLWDVATYFPDLRIINRGFGGSRLADSLANVDRLVLAYEPRLVVLYAGDNDIAGGLLAEQLAVEFERFARAVHAKLPQTRILYLAIKPSILRWLNVDRMVTANEMIRAICSRDDRLGFLDLGPLMLGWDERPRPELFVSDGLHLSPLGYQVWTAALRPLLAPPPPVTTSAAVTTR
jgi:lysophospholipase L1-like esterase